MVTAVQEEIHYCSPGFSSGKQKKVRSASQSPFRSENTFATFEADQILLALQQLASNSNPANIHNNLSKVSKLPKLFMTTMPTFDGKSEKLELFEDLFQSLKIHNQLSEEDKANYFHSLMRGDELQTFKNISSRNRDNLTEILTVFRRKYVKPQSIATAKHKFQQLVFNPANQKLIDFFGRTPEIGKKCFRSWCPSNHWAIHIRQDASTPAEINKLGSLGERHDEEILTHLERKLELNSLEYPDESQMNTMTHKQQTEGNNDSAGNINSDTHDSNKKFSHFETLLSLTCLHTNALKSYSLLPNFVKITIQNRNYKEIPSWKENYGEFTYSLRHLTMYSWWIRQLLSASIILHLCVELLQTIGHLVNCWQLWFLCGTIIDEQSASKTEKKINHGNIFHKRGGVSQYNREDYGHKEKSDIPGLHEN